MNAIVLGILLSAISPAWSAEFHIASGDADGLSAAVDEANANDEPDTIFLAAGAYEITGSCGYSCFQITSPIVIQGAGSRSTLLKRASEYWFNFFDVDLAGDLTLRDVTLTGGYSGSGCGGAIYLAGGKLTVEYSSISNNYARFSGGGICSTEGQIIIDHSEFTGNKTSDNGGAIVSRQHGVLTIRNSHFEGNEAGSGGAIVNDQGELVITGSVIVANSAYGSGGGMSTDASGNPKYTFVDISNTTVKDNVATHGDGGGLALHTAQATISSSTISNNSSGRHGGGLYGAFGTMVITNSTISGNRSDWSGGGIMLHGEHSRVDLNNLTLAYNVADHDKDGTGDGGGIYNAPGRAGSISNSILAGNTVADEAASECAGVLSNTGFNLVQASSPGCALSTYSSNLVDVDPLLEPLGNNGGLTDTHALGIGSPAIDAGNPATCEQTDQRGVPRNCDIGAFEVGVIPPDPGFQMTAGLNDAWYNPVTDGQGFFVIVFPAIQQAFMSWFTYDVTRPGQGVTAKLGEPAHRWLTAQGPFTDNQALLDVYITGGGIFDSPEPVPSTERDGTLLLEFSGCNRGTVTYDIPSIGRQGLVPIQRVSRDNAALCEELMR